MSAPQQDYPEHNKLMAVSDKSQEIGQFVDWLADEKDIQVVKSTTDAFITNTYSGTTLVPLLAEYFGIDLEKIEAEKRRMLEVLRGE